MKSVVQGQILGQQVQTDTVNDEGAQQVGQSEQGAQPSEYQLIVVQ